MSVPQKPPPESSVPGGNLIGGRRRNQFWRGHGSPSVLNEVFSNLAAMRFEGANGPRKEFIPAGFPLTTQPGRKTKSAPHPPDMVRSGRVLQTSVKSPASPPKSHLPSRDSPSPSSASSPGQPEADDFCFPLLYSSTVCGFAARTASIVSSGYCHHFTIKSVLFPYCSGSISSLKIFSNTSFAIVVLMLPDSVSLISEARCSGEKISWSASTFPSSAGWFRLSAS